MFLFFFEIWNEFSFEEGKLLFIIYFHGNHDRYRKHNITIRWVSF